jgi:hypothetical protein
MPFATLRPQLSQQRRYTYIPTSEVIADDKAEANAIHMADVLHAALSSPLVSRPYPKMCGCGYPTHYGRCQPKLMPTTPQQAVVMLQHIINLFPDEPDVIFTAAVAISDIATETANNGIIFDPLMGSDFVPPSPATATESSKGPIQVFNDRELATVLHGLRLIQEQANGHADCSFAYCDHFDEAEALTDDEIDALCERLNLGDGKPNRVVVRVENGEAEILELPAGAEAVIIDYDELSSLLSEALESAISGLPKDLQPEVRAFFFYEE